jgi:hypothetical protein
MAVVFAARGASASFTRGNDATAGRAHRAVADGEPLDRWIEGPCPCKNPTVPAPLVYDPCAYQIHEDPYEGRVALEEFLARVPEYAVDEGGLVRVHSTNVRGFAHLPLRFRPVAG